jgi:hypothetical protein
MSGEIELISDGDGIAVIGDPSAVDLFLESEGLPSRDLGLSRLRNVLSTGGATAQAGSQVAEKSGRWVKLTKESAEILKTSRLMKGETQHVSRAIAMKDNKAAHILQIVTKPGTALTNPALLSGAGGLMSQMAMQQAIRGDHRLPGRDRREGRRHLARAEGRRPVSHGRGRLRTRRGDEPARGTRPGR